MTRTFISHSLNEHDMGFYGGNWLTSRDTKHSIGKVNKIDTENSTREKFIMSSSQQ